jgi:hypothetical protein
MRPALLVEQVRANVRRRGQRVSRMRGFRHWRWHLDEMYVKLNGETVFLANMESESRLRHSAEWCRLARSLFVDPRARAAKVGSGIAAVDPGHAGMVAAIRLFIKRDPINGGARERECPLTSLPTPTHLLNVNAVMQS